MRSLVILCRQQVFAFVGIDYEGIDFAAVRNDRLNIFCKSQVTFRERLLSYKGFPGRGSGNLFLIFRIIVNFVMIFMMFHTLIEVPAAWFSRAGLAHSVPGISCKRARSAPRFP